MEQILVNYIICFIMGICVWLFFLRSFLIAWVQVRRSAGSKILVKVVNPVMDYWAVGSYDKEHIRFKGRRREDNPNPNRMIYVKDINNSIYNAFGVKCCDIDDAKDSIYIRKNNSYESISGANAEATDNVVQEAMTKPSLQKGLFDERTWQIIMICGLLIIAGGLFLIYRQNQTTDAHIKLVYDQVEYLINSTIVRI